MKLRLSCDCGRAITVTEGSAGVAISCVCGHSIHVPPFRKPPALFKDRLDALSDDDDGPEMLALLIIGIYVVGSIFLRHALLSYAAGRVVEVGYTVALAGHIWLLFLIVWKCHPEAIVWTVMIPFFTWYFAYQRWDIAKWALLGNVAGLFLFLANIR